MKIFSFSGELLLDLNKAKDIYYTDECWTAFVQRGVIKDWKKIRRLDARYVFLGKTYLATLKYYDTSTDVIEEIHHAYRTGEEEYVLPYAPWNDVSKWLCNDGTCTGWSLVPSKRDYKRLCEKYKNGVGWSPRF